MKIRKKIISGLSDNELLSMWRETGRSEYEGVLLLRYLPFVYGIDLDVSGDAVRAREGVRGLVGQFGPFLAGYDCESDFAAWLYWAQTTENHKNERLTAAQKDYMRRLAAADEGAVAAFDEAASGLTKPQRECIRRFFFEGAAFEAIAKETGYLTDGIRAYIEAGVAKIVPEGDTGQNGGGNIARFREAFVAYIKGERGNADAHAIELETMLDPFLSDAVEGCMRAPGDHARVIAELDREVEAAYFRPHRSRWRIAISVMIAVGVVGVFLYFAPYFAFKYFNERRPEKADDPSELIMQSNTDGPVATQAPIEDSVDIGDRAAADMIDMNDEYGAVRLVSVSETADPMGDVRPVSMPRIGMRDYNEYLKRAAIDFGDGVEGDVKITFRVNRYGHPSQIRVIEYLTPEAHKEAIRLLDIGPEWSPTEETVTIVMRFGQQ